LSVVAVRYQSDGQQFDRAMDILTDKNSELLTIINKLRTIKQDLKEMETFITIRGEMMYLRFRPQLAQLEVRIYHFIWLIVL